MQSAASQSQHVVNMLTEHDPISAEDVSNLSKAEAAASGTGQTQRGGPAAKAQVRTRCRQQVLSHILQGYTQHVQQF